MKSHRYHWENTSIQNTKHIGWLKTLRHTPENTYLQNWSPISQPQIDLSWAILRALQAWRQWEQEVEEEEDKERERERGVGHGRRGYAQDNISDDIRATLMRSCGQTQTDGRICNPTRAQLACFSVFTVVYFVFYFCITVFLRYCIYCTVKYSTVMCSIELMSFVTFQYFHFWLLWKPLLEKKQNKNCKCCIELHRMITD